MRRAAKLLTNTTSRRRSSNGTRRRLNGIKNKIGKKIGSAYSRSIYTVKHNPLRSISVAAVGLSALSGLVYWYRNNR